MPITEAVRLSQQGYQFNGWEVIAWVIAGILIGLIINEVVCND